MPVAVCFLDTLPAPIPLFDGLAPPSFSLWYMDEPFWERIPQSRGRGR